MGALLMSPLFVVSLDLLILMLLVYTSWLAFRSRNEGSQRWFLVAPLILVAFAAVLSLPDDISSLKNGTTPHPSDLVRTLALMSMLAAMILIAISSRRR